MKKLLVVVDYQNDFVKGALGFPKAATLDDGIAHLIQAYFASGDNVLITYDTHYQEYLNTREGRALPIPHCIKGSEGWRLFGRTQEECCMTCCNQQLFTICKESFGMSPQGLIQIAAQIGEIQEILLVGVVTNMCVLSNAVLLQSQWPEAQITVDASLCASFDDSLHEKALDIMEGLQMHVINRSF